MTRREYDFWKLCAQYGNTVNVANELLSSPFHPYFPVQISIPEPTPLGMFHVYGNSSLRTGSYVSSDCAMNCLSPFLIKSTDENTTKHNASVFLNKKV